MAGFRTFATGEVLTAANVNNFLMGQSVMRFADATARTAALGTDVVEGMLTYNLATDQLEVFDGTNFVVAAPEPPAGIGSNVVQTVKTDTFTTASTTDVLITGLEATITPSSATSKVLVIAQIRYSNTSTGDNTFLSIFRTSTKIGAGDDNLSAGDRHPSTTMIQDTTLLFVDSPATTSATTYSAHVRAANGTAVINRRGSDTFGKGLCSITLIEVAA